MKKLFVLITLFSCFTLNSMDLKHLKRVTSFAEDEKDPVVLQIKSKLIYAFDVVNDSIDYLLTAKGATKTLALLTPFFIMYCHYFEDNPIQGLINRIFREMGKFQGTIELHKQIGAADAFWDLMTKDPLGFAEIYLTKLVDKILKCDCNPFKCLPCF